MKKNEIGEREQGRVGMRVRERKQLRKGWRGGQLVVMKLKTSDLQDLEVLVFGPVRGPGSLGNVWALYLLG